jgi:hypothetical protein
MKAAAAKPQVRPRGAVRVSVPASVAYDLKSFQKSIADLAERLGCLACFSGAACTFQLERDFVINERRKLQVGGIGATALAAPAASATMPAKVANSLPQIQKVVASIADRLGCRACCSGFDITFRQELDFIVDQELNVRPAGF